MKTFETPVVDVMKFEVMDVLTASGASDESIDTCPEFVDCPDETPEF